MRSRTPILAVAVAFIVLGAAPTCAGQSATKVHAKPVTIASSNVVVVDRTGPAPWKGKFRIPAHVTVTNRTRIRALATALERLRRFPKGVLPCPIDFSLRYVLRFEFVVTQSQVMTVARVIADPYGCEKVTGLDYPRWASANFWRVLGEAVGVQHATVATFQERGSP
jgi:hypothetical protein